MVEKFFITRLFGEVQRRLRTDYGKRIGYPLATVPNNSLVEAMKGKFPISSGSLSVIETGSSMPERIDEFLEVSGEVLHVTGRERLVRDAAWILSRAGRRGVRTTASFMEGPYFNREAFERDLQELIGVTVTFVEE